MKICVIELAGVDADLLFGDERLANLRRLMDIGLYGKLQSAGNGTASVVPTSALAALWPPLTAACRQATMMRATPSRRSGEPQTNHSSTASAPDLSKSWTLLIDLLMNPGWDYIHFVDPALADAGRTATQSAASDLPLQLDEQIGRVLEALDDQTALLVTGVLQVHHRHSGFFLIAAPNCPISGEFQGACLADLPATLLDLAGIPLPDGHPGHSLIAGLEKQSPSEPSVDHERIVLDRLAGLGYV